LNIYLPIRATLAKDGRFNELAGPLFGLKVPEAREKALAILKEKGALIKEEEYLHEVGHCYKCGSLIEPMLMDQWFVATNKPFGSQQKSLANLALEALKNKKLRLYPQIIKKY